MPLTRNVIYKLQGLSHRRQILNVFKNIVSKTFKILGIIHISAHFFKEKLLSICISYTYYSSIDIFSKESHGGLEIMFLKHY